jgi:hypothetical protein
VVAPGLGAPPRGLPLHEAEAVLPLALPLLLTAPTALLALGDSGLEAVARELWSGDGGAGGALTRGRRCGISAGGGVHGRWRRRGAVRRCGFWRGKMRFFLDSRYSCLPAIVLLSFLPVTVGLLLAFNSRF